MGQGAYILGCGGTALSAAERDFYRDANPWGFILFARNVESRAQLRALTSELRNAVGRNAPVMIDQEGGRVQRMRAPVWRDHRPALDEMAAQPAERQQRVMYLRNLLIGAELREVGIDVNCAPIVDVARDQTHPVLLNRLYGRDVETVVRAGMATAEGLMAAGVAPVVKHLPGYGLATVDSHQDLPRVVASREELDAVDFAAFRALHDLPMGMTAHIVLDAVDPERPATVSPAVMALIRRDIGFGGLIMTDDISMEALSGDVVERSLAARAAGCDLVLHCNGEMDEMARIAAALGDMGQGAQARADHAAEARPRGGEVDLDEALAEYRRAQL